MFDSPCTTIVSHACYGHIKQVHRTACITQLLPGFCVTKGCHKGARGHDFGQQRGEARRHRHTARKRHGRTSRALCRSRFYGRAGPQLRALLSTGRNDYHPCKALTPRYHRKTGSCSAAVETWRMHQCLFQRRAKHSWMVGSHLPHSMFSRRSESPTLRCDSATGHVHQVGRYHTLSVREWLENVLRVIFNKENALSRVGACANRKYLLARALGRGVR